VGIRAVREPFPSTRPHPSEEIRLEISSSKEQNIACTKDDQDLTELTSAIATYLPDITPDCRLFSGLSTKIYSHLPRR
jgi:hypothetical protein